MLKKLSIAALLFTAISTASFANELPQRAPEETSSVSNESVNWINVHSVQVRLAPLSLLGSVFNVHGSAMVGRQVGIGLDVAYEFLTNLPSWGLTQGEWVGPSPGLYRSGRGPFRSRYMLQFDYFLNESAEQSWIVSPYLGLLSQNYAPGSDGYIVGATASYQWVFESNLVIRTGAGVNWVNPVSLGNSALFFPVLELSVGLAL